MTEKKLINTQELIERLAKHFPSPTYGFITQVRSATGYSSSNAIRTADALAMSLWPSRGLHLLGFEVKMSRNDWLNEIKKPEKAEEIAKFCHEWYIVINNADFIQEGELPSNWGLIVPSGNGMKTIKKAVVNQNVVPPDYALLAGIFRNIAEQCIPKETLKTVLASAREAGELQAGFRIRDSEDKIKQLVERIAVFEKASGVQLASWPSENEKIGDAVNQVLKGKHLKSIETIEKMRERAVNLVKYLDDECEHYKTL